MCGIVGYKGQGNASEIIVEGLKQLEYRGYDSFGVAALDRNKISIVKRVGKIGDITAKDLNLPDSRIGIGHTRWATNGGVTEANAHPHTCDGNKVAVVHNGIVENYQELRDELRKSGYKFYSETDTEVIPKLIDLYMKEGNDFRSATRKALSRIDGSFAIAAINNENEEIAFGRRGSPLVLGSDGKNFYVGSDVTAFLAHTNNVIYLDDDEYGIIDNKINIYDLNDDKEIKKSPITIKWSLEQAKKGNYPHYMIKEINEQVFTIPRSIEQDSKLIEDTVKSLKGADKIFFVGCGTSYHAGLIGSHLFAKLANIETKTILASEFEDHVKFVTAKTVVVGISQSGETADLICALKDAKSRGAKIISVVNVMGSTITRLSDINIMMNVGPEICVLSTKSYTGQVAILTYLAYALAGRPKEGKELIKQASSHVSHVIESSIKELRPLAKRFKDKTSLFLIGRGIAYPLALESALKIKEVSYIHAEGFAGGELKHGTIALIEKDIPVITLATKEIRPLILSNASELRARGGFIIGVDSENNELYDFFINVPEVGDANPLLRILPIQIFAYYLALERNCDPDKPRNLAKSVTVK